MALPNKWGEKKEFEMAAVQFRKMTRWTKFCAVIGYPCGQDGAILPVRGYTLSPAKKFPKSRILLKFSIDQACWLEAAGYWPRSFLCFWTLYLSRSMKTQTKLWLISSHLDPYFLALRKEATQKHHTIYRWINLFIFSTNVHRMSYLTKNTTTFASGYRTMKEFNYHLYIVKSS